MTDETSGRELSAEESEQVRAELRSKIKQPANFIKWAKYEEWEQAQACALLLGMEPDKMPNRETGLHLFLRGEQWIGEYYELFELLHSSSGPDSRAPDDYFHWARRKGYTVPPELSKAVAEQAEREINVPTLIPADEGCIGDKAEQTLLSVIGLLATKIAGDKRKFRNGSEISASAIVRELESHVALLENSHGLGSSNLEKKISAGLQSLRERN